MRAEDLKKAILRTSGGVEFYGYKIHKQLATKKIEVSTSRLYRALAEIVRQGFLEYQWQKGRLGPRQRVYELSAKGRKEREKILLDARAIKPEVPSRTRIVCEPMRKHQQNTPKKGNCATRSCCST